MMSRNAGVCMKLIAPLLLFAALANASSLVTVNTTTTSDSCSQSGVTPSCSIDNGKTLANGIVYGSLIPPDGKFFPLTPGLLDNFQLNGQAVTVRTPGTSAVSTATGNQDIMLDVIGGTGTGDLVLKFRLDGQGLGDMLTGTAISMFSVSAGSTELLNTHCPFDGPGFMCSSMAVTVDIPFTFDLPFELTEKVSLLTEGLSGGSASGQLYAIFRGLNVFQGGVLDEGATVVDPPVSTPEPSDWLMILTGLSLATLMFRPTR
jgi:hypothetical protein